MSDDKMNFSEDSERAWLRGALHDGVVTVSFTKADGSVRDMKCSLSENLIPSDKLPKGESTKKITNDTAQRVFDVEKQEWRSFRWDNINAVTLTITAE